jgi:hypothetical protein
MANTGKANVILLAPGDNVVVACEQISAGSSVDVEGMVFEVSCNVGVGHKIARGDIQSEEKILKYGAPIGHATEAIARGAHVHIHNIESDYLHSHTARKKLEDAS